MLKIFILNIAESNRRHQIVPCSQILGTKSAASNRPHQIGGIKTAASNFGGPIQTCAGYRSPYPYPTSGIGVRTRTRSGTGTIVCTRTQIPDLPENFKNSKNIDKIKFRRKNSSSKVQQSTFRKPIVFCLRK